MLAVVRSRCAIRAPVHSLTAPIFFRSLSFAARLSKAPPPSHAAGKTKVPDNAAKHVPPTPKSKPNAVSDDLMKARLEQSEEDQSSSTFAWYMTRWGVPIVFFGSIGALIWRGVYLAWESDEEITDPSTFQGPNLTVPADYDLEVESREYPPNLPLSEEQLKGGSLARLSLDQAQQIVERTLVERAIPAERPETVFGGPKPADMDIEDTFSTRTGLKLYSAINYFFPGKLTERRLTPIQDRAMTIVEDPPLEAYDKLQNGVSETYVQTDGVEGELAGLQPLSFTNLTVVNAALGNTPLALVPRWGATSRERAVARTMALSSDPLTESEALTLAVKRAQSEHLYLHDRQHRVLQLDLPYDERYLESLGDLFGTKANRSLGDGKGVADLPLATRARAPLEIWSITVAQPELGIARQYTPVQSPLEAYVTRTLELIVKRYPHSEVPDYLHRVPLEGEVRVAGFNKEWDERWTLDAIARAQKGQEPHPNMEPRMPSLDVVPSDLTHQEPSVVEPQVVRTAPPPDTPRIKEIYMLVAGTGVLPAYQLVRGILQPLQEDGVEMERCPETGVDRWQRTLDERALREKAHFTVLYAAPNPDSFLLTPEWSELVKKHPERVSVQLFAESAQAVEAGQLLLANDGLTSPLQGQLERAGKSWLGSKESSTKVVSVDGLPVHEGRIDQKGVHAALAPLLEQYKTGPTSAALPSASTTTTTTTTSGSLEVTEFEPRKLSTGVKRESAVLVCGPDGFIAAMAGPKGRDGRTQGRLGGLLATLGVRSEHVWKL